MVVATTSITDSCVANASVPLSLSLIHILIIEGGAGLKGAKIQSFLDHRIAMAFSIAGLAAQGETTIQDSQCVDVSCLLYTSRCV